MADGRSRKIVHKTVVESSSSRKDVGFAGKTLQSQLNGVLSDAVERILDRSQKLYPGIS